MARYIDEILQPGETALHSANAHWIIRFPVNLARIVASIRFALSRTPNGWFRDEGDEMIGAVAPPLAFRHSITARQGAYP